MWDSIRFAFGGALGRLKSTKGRRTKHPRCVAERGNEADQPRKVG